MPRLSLILQLLPPKIEAVRNWIASHPKSFEDSGVYGLYLDFPFHKPLSECRYLVGYLTKDRSKANYSLDSGYYTKMKFGKEILSEKSKVKTPV